MTNSFDSIYHTSYLMAMTLPSSWPSLHRLLEATTFFATRFSRKHPPRCHSSQMAKTRIIIFSTGGEVTHPPSRPQYPFTHPSLLPPSVPVPAPPPLSNLPSQPKSQDFRHLPQISGLKTDTDGNMHLRQLAESVYLTIV